MNIRDFAINKLLEHVDLDTMLMSTEISEKRRQRLTELKRQWKLGDSVLYYCSDQEEWDAGMGSEGYALVRNEEVIDTLVLKMN